MQETTDTFHTAIVDDLLRGVNDWRNIQDIVRLTFKALVEIVKNQGSSIRELERQLPTRITCPELQSAFSQKADYAEVLANISDLRTHLDSHGQSLKFNQHSIQKIPRVNYPTI